jgi:hypothetical protein
MNTDSLIRALVAFTFFAAAVLFAAGVYATTITVNNIDGAGEGFNDATPAAPVGGNPGVTLGQQRLNAFQHAANILASRITSGVTIVVDAKMDPQFCDAGSAVLGSAGTTTVFRDFTGAPLAGTWYPQALANALAGSDLSPANADISATFNSNLNGSAGCLGGKGWYYGYDSNPGTDIDFVSVVMHEICHGLGFQTFVSQTGAKFSGFNDMYMVHLESHGASPSGYPSMNDAQRAAGNIADPNLHWTGASVLANHALTAGLSNGHVRMHGPNPYQQGSSVSHWSTALSPNELMEPSYTGANHDPALAQWLFQDIGWTLSPAVAVAITSFQARAVDGNVELRATFDSSFDAVDVTVYRAEDAGYVPIETVPAPGAGEFVYLDATVAPGHAYTYRIGVTDGDGEFLSSAERVALPALSSVLEQNVPNPFNPTTSIGFVLSTTGRVTLMVFDAGGRLVRTLVNETLPAGPHDALWDGRDEEGRSVGSGVYFYRIETGPFVESRKMVLLR